MKMIVETRETNPSSLKFRPQFLNIVKSHNSKINPRSLLTNADKFSKHILYLTLRFAEFCHANVIVFIFFFFRSVKAGLVPIIETTWFLMWPK